MRGPRRVVLVAGTLAALVGVFVFVPSGVALANHGFDYADCPTDLSLTASAAPITFGERTTLAGRLAANPITDAGAVIQNQAIALRRIITGSVGSIFTASAQTDNSGNFSVRLQPSQSANHYAIFGPTGPCPAEISSPVFIGVRVLISIRSSNNRPRPGQSFQIFGCVSPNHTGQTVDVLRRKAASGSPILTTPVGLDSRSCYSRTFVINTASAQWLFRTRYSPQSHPLASASDHQGNITPFISVTTRAA